MYNSRHLSFEYLQPVELPLKQTIRLTSRDEDEQSLTSLTSLFHICMLAYALLAFLFQKLPQKRYYPSGSELSHTS